MKNKRKIYVLLTLVLLVWGTIIYKVITGLNPELPEHEVNQEIVVKDFKVSTQTKEFSVSEVDRDPFLGTWLKKPVSVKSQKKKERPSMVWPSIEYLGIVKSKIKTQQVFIVSINSKQRLLKKGQTTDSVKLVYGSNKTITIKYKSKNKTFKRKHQK